MKIPSRVKRKAPSCSSVSHFSDKAQPFSGNTPHLIAEHLFQLFYRRSPYSTYGSDNKFIVAGRLIQILYFESTADFPLYLLYMIDGSKHSIPVSSRQKNVPTVRTPDKVFLSVRTVVTRVLARTAEIRKFHNVQIPHFCRCSISNVEKI